MGYESVSEAAKRLGVTPRAIQKRIKEGKIKGALLVGSTYIIPTQKAETSKEDTIVASREWDSPFPLISGFIIPAKSKDYIEGIPDPDLRGIAQAEQFYFSGDNKKAIAILEKYIESNDTRLSLSASLLYVFACMAIGKSHQTQIGLSIIKKNVLHTLERSDDDYLRAFAILIATSQAVLLHKPIPDMPLLRTVLRDLPNGLRQMAAYVLAHKAYLSKNYERTLGICDTVIYYSDKLYTIPHIHLLLISSIALINMKRTEEAKKRCMEAYSIAKAEEYIEPFAENHMLLGGLAEICLKREHPEDFARLVEITRNYGPTWSRVHNSEMNNTVTGGLTTTEFTVAMLYNQSWSIKEISAHMELSERMVKYYVSTVYDKLGISSREELRKFMIN